VGSFRRGPEPAGSKTKVLSGAPRHPELDGDGDTQPPSLTSLGGRATRRYLVADQQLEASCAEATMDYLTDADAPQCPEPAQGTQEPSMPNRRRSYGGSRQGRDDGPGSGANGAGWAL